MSFTNTTPRCETLDTGRFMDDLVANVQGVPNSSRAVEAFDCRVDAGEAAGLARMTFICGRSLFPAGMVPQPALAANRTL